VGKVVGVKRILLLALTAAAMAVPAGAHAAAPCRDQIYNEWYGSGKISTTYPIECYRDALKHVPTDARIYSNLSGDIKAALQAAIARNDHPSGGSGGPTAVGSGPPPATGPHQVKGRSATRTRPTAASPPRSDSPSLRPQPVAVAPLASTSGGGGVPTPILVLGAVAILLALAGLVGTGVQSARKRRAA
jgi:hypothetical protein